MDEQQCIDYISNTFAGVETSTNMTYMFFFYGVDRMLPFVTMAFADNEYDQVSQLDRDGVYRLNIGVRKPTFQSLFGTEKIDISKYDFTALDTIMPHPEYAAQSWLCVLSPSNATFQALQPLLAEGYDLAVKRADRRANT